MRFSWRRRLWAEQTGMVTVEAAYALAAIAAFLVVAVEVVAGVAAYIRCTDAAREVARLAAAGDDGAGSVGAQLAPSGARIEISSGGERVTVVVSASLPLLPMASVSATSIAAREPGGGDLGGGGLEAGDLEAGDGEGGDRVEAPETGVAG